MESKDRKPRGYWTRERCFNLAKGCTSIKEYEKKSYQAYAVSLKNGWLKDYTWFQHSRQPKGYWTEENCYAEAKNFKTKADFKNQSSKAYGAAVRNGWLKNYEWLHGLRLPNGYWTKQKCYDEAKKYKSQAEFRRCAPTPYNTAKKNKWLSDYTWFETGSLIEHPIYIVYCYKDEETNAVYVGLTNNIKQRHNQHCNGFLRHGERKYDIVHNYFCSIGKPVPNPVILKKDIHANDAQNYEAHYVEFFKKKGLKVLNLAKAGSLGSSFRKWNKENCYKEAQKYKTINDFENNNPSACHAARKNGWIKDYTWLVKRFVWSKDLCYDEAKKYKSKVEFKNAANGAYQAANKNGWLKDYDWFTKPSSIKKWNRNACYNEAQKYKSKAEFKKNNQSAYNAARKNGWTDDYIWFFKPCLIRKWNKDACYNEAQKYKSRSDFFNHNGAAYNAAKKNGWLNDYTWFQRPSAYNKELCYDEAKKFETKTEFRRNSYGAYQAAYRNGWLDEFFPKNK